MKYYRVVVLIFSLVFVAFAQNGAVVVSSGYDQTSALVFAPGQIVRLRVAGLPVVLARYRLPQYATALPLPAELAGFSVTVSQSNGIAVGPTLTAPMIAVDQHPICTDLTSGNGDLLADCFLTVLTVQMPFELALPSPPDSIIAKLPTTRVVITRDGKNSVPFSALTLSDQIRVVTTCDSLRPLGSACAFPGFPVVTHANGAMVTRQTPAEPGEVVTIYAWGLGPTEPSVETGKATPPAILRLSGDRIVVAFDFRSNAASSWRFGQAGARPEFVGLTPGQVGLYQINVKLPAAFPASEACGAFVGSNLTINVAGDNSFDGAAICVAVPNER